MSPWARRSRPSSTRWCSRRWPWSTSGSGVMLGVIVLVFAPFVVLAPGGVWDSLWTQASRPLQIESLGAGFLLVAHHVFGTGVAVESSHGSQNLAGTGPDVLAVGQSVL